MRNFILASIGLLAASGACYWNESRLARNNAMRKIPGVIAEELKQYSFPPTFAELKANLEYFGHWEGFKIAIDEHREEFLAELDKQIKTASNGL